MAVSTTHAMDGAGESRTAGSGEAALVPTKATARLDYLDNLRFSLTILVICHHCNSAYGSIGGWSYVVHERGGVISEILATMFAGVTQAFFMSSFFLISAYFTAPGVDGKGSWGYARRRLTRLGIPILVYYYVLSVLLHFIVDRFEGNTTLGLFAYFHTYFGVITSPGPLWFTSALLLFEGVYLVIRQVLKRVSPGHRTYAPPKDLHILIFIVAVGAFAFLVRAYLGRAMHFWHFNLGYFPLYICMFTFGIVARRSGWFAKLSRAQANRWFYAALVAIAVMPVILVINAILGYDEYDFLRGVTWQCYVYAAWEPILCVGINMKLIVLYRDRFNGSSALSRRAARSAYTAYIFHAFFIVIATYLFTFFSLGRIPEIVLMWPVAVIPCFLFADALRRLPLLRRIL